MLGCWRSGEASNAKVFVTSVAALLSKYPDHVIYAVTNPMEGLPMKFTWVPSLKEIKDACEVEMLPIYRRERQERLVAETLAARAEAEERKNRPSTAELKAKYGENWGMTSLDPKEAPEARRAPTIPQLIQHYEANPGRLQWLANLLPSMRGEIEESK